MASKRTGPSRPEQQDDGEQKSPRRGRGGRKPGEWRHVTPEAIREFRQEHRISRARLAGALGVSSTSVQNWESGTVATMRTQQQLADLIRAGPAALATIRSAPGTVGSWDPSAVLGPQILTTGAIVGAYLQSNPGKVTNDDLVELIRSVRAALT